METGNKAGNRFLRIQSVVNSLPLEDILETAESVAPLIPAAGTPILYVIKALKLLIKARPVANSLLNSGYKVANALQPPAKQTEATDSNFNPAINEDNNQAEAERAEILTMLDQMVDIAAEDGELSEKELSYLMDIAQEVDVNEKVIIAKVKMKCIQNK